VNRTTTPATPADTLRRAAALLRQHATAAEREIETNPYWHSQIAERPDWWANGVTNGLGGAGGDFAALLSPTAGVELAKWLEAEARQSVVSPHAVAVARLLLGEGVQR
jgi:hypothetical protein